MVVQPYLSFDGRCDEAVEFYRRAIGAQVEMIMRFKDSPDPEALKMVPPASHNKVMHAAFRIGDSLIMASDGGCQNAGKFEGINLSLSVKDPAEAARVYAALADGGQAQMALTKTFFSESFGTLVDRFGVSWMVIAESQ